MIAKEIINLLGPNSESRFFKEEINTKSIIYILKKKNIKQIENKITIETRIVHDGEVNK